MLSTIDCQGTTKAWDRAGVALHLIDLGGQALDTSSAMGRFFLTVMAGAAELERGLIRERTSTALQHKKANGTKLGMPRLGFAKRVPGAWTDEVTGELEAVRLILRKRRYARASFRQIAGELQAAGTQYQEGRRVARLNRARRLGAAAGIRPVDQSGGLNGAGVRHLWRIGRRYFPERRRYGIHGFSPGKACWPTTSVN
ncbi:MAG: recombinase family protein [Pseudomonas sp.]